MKPYDYWLIIWHDGAGRIHHPMCFDVGAEPEPYCEAVMESAHKDRDQKRFKPTGYELHRLLVVKSEGLDVT